MSFSLFWGLKAPEPSVQAVPPALASGRRAPALARDGVRVAVIGDGLAAATAIARLAAKAPDVIGTVDVYALADPIGPGKAYGADTPEAMLLNHPVSAMRFMDETGEHFLGYLRKGPYPGATLHDVLPRSVFGSYVAATTAALIATDPRVKVIRNEVTRVTPGNQLIDVEAGGITRRYDDVFICVGGGKYRDKLATGVANLPANLAGKSVALVGASLSAVDVINELFFGRPASHAPKKIVCFQRNAGFRLVKPRKRRDFTPKIMTHDLVARTTSFKASEIVSYIGLELRQQGIDYDFMTYGGIVDSPTFNEQLQRTLARLAADPDDEGHHPEFAVYGVMIAIIPALLAIFEQNRISPEEAETFRKSGEKEVLAYLAPMPTLVAARLAKLMEDGKLEIRDGLNLGRHAASLKLFDHQLDVRGINGIIRTSDDLPSPVRGLVEAKHAYLSRLGGISYDPETSRMNLQGAVNLRMPYIIGQLKKGQQFDCSESQVIYMDCNKAVSAVAASVENRS